MNKSAKALAVDEQAGSGIDLVQYVPSFVTVVANKWARSSSALYLNLFGIGIVDWRLMGLLAVEPWIQASRVDEVVGMDKGAVSRSLQTLEKRGLAMTRRNADDPRRREMALTAAGREMHDKIARIALDRERRLLKGFSAEEKQLLLGFLGRMRRNLSDFCNTEAEIGTYRDGTD